jgi:uncharacterized membrane protein YfcA
MRKELPGSVKGVAVGFSNLIVVAICIAATTRYSAADAVFLVCVLGFLPAVLTGALVGHLAAALHHMNRRILLCLMIGVGCLVVVALGDMFRVQDLVLVACIPTAAACSILERWTRAKPEHTLPLARVA